MAKIFTHLQAHLSRLKPPLERLSRQRWLLTAIFGTVAFAIIVGSLLYTQQLVTSLVQREQRLIRFYADVLQTFASTSSIESIFLLDRVTPMIDFPCVITDSSGTPLEPYEQFTLNVDLQRLGQTPQAQKVALQALTLSMANEYPPVEIRDPKGKVVNYIYYTNSWVVKRLRILPYVEFALVALFVAAGYVALMMRRRRDESLIWVGMARETAHQLGTPISSILGWLEILSEKNQFNSESWQAALDELKHDAERLRSIAQRFSAIGSSPKLERTNICSVVEASVAYMRKRLPQRGKTIALAWQCSEPTVSTFANPELLSWVIENLIKNAAEAIEKPNGTITIRVTTAKRRQHPIVQITISDTGRGMSTSVRRNAFAPGFTTKERGWGLGLALAKRIVEQYHKGRIYVVHSAINRGTTIAIELPRQEN